MAGRPKKIIAEEVTTTNIKVEIKYDVSLKEKISLLLKTKMPLCFDREPQGLNSNVEKLADDIISLIE